MDIAPPHHGHTNPTDDATVAAVLQQTLPTSDAVSHIFFTSGSTGRPKGCISTHNCLVSYCQGKNQCHRITADSVVFVASPHTFDPSFGDMFATWTTGGIVACATKHATFTTLGHCLSLTQATHVLTTPALLGTMPNGPPKRYNYLPTLQVVALGGEATPIPLALAWLPHLALLLNTYGTTECCVYQTCATIERIETTATRNTTDTTTATTTDTTTTTTATTNTTMACSNPKRLGLPIPGNVLIFAKEPGDNPLLQVPPQSNELAELWITGAQVGVGYLNRPCITDKYKTINGTNYFRTGDIVQMDVDGPLLLGRKDSQIKLNGQRVELGEIEAGVLRAAGKDLLRSIAVVLVRSKGGGGKPPSNRHQSQRLVAWCVPASSTALCLDIDAEEEEEEEDEEETGGQQKDRTPAQQQQQQGRRPDIEAAAIFHDVFRWLMQKELPLHMIPSRLGFLASLPVTSSGKIAKRPLLRRGLPLAPQRHHQPHEEDMHAPHEEPQEEPQDKELEPTPSTSQNQNQNQESLLRVVSALWSEVLEVPLDVTGGPVHFTEMGGDSLAALRVCQRLSTMLSSPATVATSSSPSPAPPPAPTSFAGEALGSLSPLELLKRPRITEYVRYLKETVPHLLPNCTSGTTTTTTTLPTDKGTELLYRASLCGARKCVARLLQVGVSPLRFGTTSPLHAACARGNVHTARTLLTQGGGLCNSKNNHGATPLLLAASAQGRFTTSTRTLALITLLLEHGALLSSVDGSGQSVLHAAARSGQSTAVLKCLVQAGLGGSGTKKTCRGNYKGNKGNKGKQGKGNPTGQQPGNNHNAGHKMDAKMLKTKGPMALWTDKWGRTPLHWASINGHRGVCVYLSSIEEGSVSLGVKDHRGETPIDCAERRALCSAKERPDGARSSVWGDIATLLGGSGTTKHLKTKH
jgi:acyl-CoA synthetase (AMP-forming)/AMP-acid ligase II